MTEDLDRDTREVMDLLRQALMTSGMTQAGFAHTLGTSAPRLSTYLSGQTRPSAWFCLRARRLASALETASERGLMSAPVAASAMRENRAAGQTAWVWRMLLQGRDHLGLILAEGDATLIGSWEAEPGSVGSAGWDALLAALVASEFERVDLVAPSWSRVAQLEEPWMPEHPFLSPARVRAQTPDWLGRLNIFVPARDLVTA